MSTQLFRPEVLHERQVQWLGSIRIGRPPSFAWVTGIAIALATALVGFSLWGEVTRKAKLPGLLLPTAGLITVGAPQAGVLSEVLVKEGDVVQAGQVLMRLKSERMLGSGDAAALNAQALAQRHSSLSTERLLTQQQARQRQDALADRLRSLQTEERQAQAELDTNRLRAQLAARSHARFAELALNGFVSDQQAQQKQDELLDLQLREGNAWRSLQGLQREIQATQAELLGNQTAGQTSLAQMDRSLAALRQESTENEARSGLTITAPKAGVVSALSLHIGQAIQVGQVLVSLVPQVDGAQELEAQLYARSRTAGFVSKGQVVWLRYAAYPYQKFGMAKGEVLSVSQTPLAAQDLPAGQAQALMHGGPTNEPLYRISVRLKQQHVDTYGQKQILKTGMALDADVLQDRRAVWEWLFEPIVSAKVMLK